MIATQLVTQTCELKQILVEINDVLGLVCHFPEQVAKPDQLNYVHQVPFSLLFE